MNKTDLSIATITLARDDEEEQLLRESLEELSRHGIAVFVTDGGSSPGFLDFLKNLPNIVLSETNAKGLFAQVTNSLSAAYKSGSAFILYAESDKKYFFQKGLSLFLDHTSVNEQTGVVMASRSDAGFASYPAFQRMTETAINNCCTEVTGLALDYTYGPFLLNRQLVPCLEPVKEDIAWGWRPYIFGMAHRTGRSLAEFRGDFFCPPEQQEDNPAERIYRMRQLAQNIQGLVLSANVFV